MPLLEGIHRISCAPETREKSSDLINPGPDLPASVGGFPAKLESGLLWAWGYWQW